MSKCANCPNEAFFTYALTDTFGIDYCSQHVPKFLQKQKNAGMLPLRVEAPEVVALPKKVVKKKVELEEAVE
jgi:hypothetical protein